ncbi:antibiotic biosynthesis monooxygenase [Paenibacillus psychroresistens]|uniref:Antibiotic biosynthesis monooxygenase n=1 Tax=Paenibacillus psychroresistens TaxID=1778678 RepID=A0A6B8RPS0_9BACL|nr:antibiotic biosynthesis monooxygenase [Paenibacillus psychroresistens]QGQ97692.1 antibiotic biosynthesis monooxygenase [Paenibacillus psychroresistens]
MTANQQVIIIVRFQLKPGSDKQAFFDNLKPLFDTMSKEPTFVNGIVQENVDNPDEIVFYEIWNCNKEAWLANEETKVYRQGPYTKAAEFLLGRELSFFSPIGEWGTSVTAGNHYS